MTFQEAVSQLGQRYEHVRVIETKSGYKVLEVGGYPPLPVGFYYAEDSVDSYLLELLFAHFPDLDPEEFAVGWSD